jgi:hypothetical protein
MAENSGLWKIEHCVLVYAVLSGGDALHRANAEKTLETVALGVFL